MKPEEVLDAMGIADRMKDILRGKTLTPDQMELILHIVKNELRLVTHG